jgi:hypothetical protein
MRSIIMMMKNSFNEWEKFHLCKVGFLIGAMKKYFGTLNLSIKTFDRLMNPKSNPIKPQ